MITQSELLKVLNYDHITGIFTWKKPLSSKFNKNDIVGNLHTSGHLRVTLFEKKYYLHRLAWLYVYGEMTKYQIDHINGKKTDNRICNLREATNMQNSQNKTVKNSTSGYKGVTWAKSVNKWKAQITFNYKNKHLGYFDNKLQAYNAYKVAALKFHGEFAKLEF